MWCNLQKRENEKAAENLCNNDFLVQSEAKEGVGGKGKI